MQIKDMALKFSGAYKQCKPCTGGSSSYNKKGHRPYPDFDTISEGVPYPYIGGASSSSTPAWDFTTSNYPGARYAGDRTPRGRDSASVCDVVLEDEDEPKEWMAQVEPGVHITFVSLPNGGNDLKRIRFRYRQLSINYGCLDNYICYKLFEVHHKLNLNWCCGYWISDSVEMWNQIFCNKYLRA